MFIINTILFILLLVTYYAILKQVFDFPFLFYGFAIGIWSGLRKKEVTPQSYAKLTRFETVSILIMCMSFIFLVFRFNLWTSAYLQIWKNPLLLSISFFISVFQASKGQSGNPIQRNAASFVSFSAWPILIIVVIGVIAPSAIQPLIFKWSIISACALLLLAMLWSTRNIPDQIQNYESIEGKHNRLSESINSLQQIAFLIGNSEDWRTVRDAINDVNSWSTQSLKLLQEGKYQESDTLIIQAEIETSRIIRGFEDRIKLSLKDELESRLNQAINEIKRLELEFAKEGFAPENLNQLNKQIIILQEKIDSLDENDKDVLSQLEPFESLYREIVETRTALRFRKNLDSTFNPMLKDIEDGNVLIKVAQDLGLETNQVKETSNQLSATLDNLQKGQINTSKELILAYNTVQKTYSSFQTSTALLTASINWKWNQHHLDSGKITFYIPKFISTSEVTRCVAVVRFENKETETVNFVLSGTLLELPSDNKITIKPTLRTHGVHQFSVAGKKGGKATLTISSQDLLNSNIHESFDIRVRQSIIENAQSALLFATPIGGIGVLSFWMYGIDIKVATPVGAAIGGVFGLAIFALNVLKYRRYIA